MSQTDAVVEHLAAAHDEIERIDRVRRGGFPRYRIYERACAETDLREGARELGRVLAVDFLHARPGVVA